MMRLITFIAALAAAVDACKCLEQTPNQAYCGADWVARVKVNGRNEEHAAPDNFYNIKYDVQQIEVFKKPSTLATLPSTIYGSSICPLLIVKKRGEYLLAGSYTDGRLTTNLCGQVRPDVPNSWSVVLEWNQVPAEFPATMKEFNC